MSTHIATRRAVRAARTVAAGLLTAAIVATPALAQHAPSYAASVRPAVTTMDVIGRSIARGFHYSQQGQFDRARQEFRKSAELERRSGYLPETSLWQVAATHYAQNDALGAARTLDELAGLAAQHGNREVQAKARLEAAFLYQRAGEASRAVDAAREAKALAKYANVTPELRAEIEQRVGA